MRLRHVTTFALPLLLAACATGLPVGPPVVVPGGKFLAVQGEAALTVRAYLTDASGQRAEVSGAACDVTSSLYSAKLTTPARLVVPNFGPQSPVLTFTCAANGLRGQAQQGIATYLPPPAFYGAPYGPYGWYGPGWGWYGRGYPISDYPNVAVLLR